MQVKPYKQNFSHSCLVASLLMLTSNKYKQRLEKEIFLKGTSRIYPYYVVGIPHEFSRALDLNVTVYTDNKFFTGVLKAAFSKNKQIVVIHRKIDIKLIRQLIRKSPIICHIDNHYLGDYSHASHFVVIENINKNKVSIVDPYYGKRCVLSEKNLLASITSLKKHIKMCPLVFVKD